MYISNLHNAGNVSLNAGSVLGFANITITLICGRLSTADGNLRANANANLNTNHSHFPYHSLGRGRGDRGGVPGRKCPPIHFYSKVGDNPISLIMNPGEGICGSLFINKRRKGLTTG